MKTSEVDFAELVKLLGLKIINIQILQGGKIILMNLRRAKKNYTMTISSEMLEIKDSQGNILEKIAIVPMIPEPEPYIPSTGIPMPIDWRRPYEHYDSDGTWNTNTYDKSNLDFIKQYMTKMSVEKEAK